VGEKKKRVSAGFAWEGEVLMRRGKRKKLSLMFNVGKRKPESVKGKECVEWDEGNFSSHGEKGKV